MFWCFAANTFSGVVFQAFPKMFSAGLDINVLANVDVNEQRFREYWAVYQELIMILYMMKGVTVAAIDVSLEIFLSFVGCMK